jgi:hypothetical protein
LKIINHVSEIENNADLFIPFALPFFYILSSTKSGGFLVVNISEGVDKKRQFTNLGVNDIIL